MQRCNPVKKKKRFTKIRIFFCCIIAFFVLLVFYYFKVVCPMIEKLSEEKIRAVATIEISKVVGDVLIEDEIKYDDIVNIRYSSGGEIELIELNSVNVNILIRKITQKVQDCFNDLKNQKIGIGLGTFTGIPFLYNRGPNVMLKLVPVGSVKTEIKSNFTAAGINQTLHRVGFVVSSNIGMILPVKNRNFKTELEVLLCESVIVGKIPQIYLGT